MKYVNTVIAVTSSTVEEVTTLISITAIGEVQHPRVTLLDVADEWLRSMHDSDLPCPKASDHIGLYDCPIDYRNMDMMAESVDPVTQTVTHYLVTYVPNLASSDER